MYGWHSPAPPDSCAYVTPQVFQLLAPLGAHRVLDLGCGNGALAELLTRTGYEVVGVDPDPSGIAIAKARCPTVPFYQATVGDDPITGVLRHEPSFDAVISTEVIEHLLYPRELLQFANQVLRPNGHLIVSTPYHGYIKNLALSFFNRFDSHHHPLRDGGHVKFFSAKTIRLLMQSQGFQPIDVLGAGRVPFLWKSMVVLARKL